MAMDQRAHVRIAGGAFAAVLMCSVSTVALAGPRHAPRQPAATQAQVDQIMSELQAERTAREAAEARLQALTDRLAALEQTTQTVASNSEAQTTAVADLSSTVSTLNGLPRPAVNNGRMTIATQDGRFSASMRGVVMLDAAYYNQSSPGPLATDLRRSAGGDAVRARDLNSGTNFRRARFGMEGRVFKDFTWSMIFEFGGSGAENTGGLFEGYAQYNGIANTAIRVGAFEPQAGMMANVSTGGMMIMERAAAGDITRGIAAGDSRVALQVQHWGDIGSDADPVSAYYMWSAALTGNSINTLNSLGGFGTQNFGEQSGLVGRAVVAPFAGQDWQAHLGVNGSYVLRPADTTGPDATGAIPAGSQVVRIQERPELRVDGTRFVDTGNIDANHAWHWGLEAAFQRQNLLIEGEYFNFGIERRNSVLSDPRFSGWYVEGSWMITGERRPYNKTGGVFDGPSPQYPWVPGSGGYGAWELAARYSTTDLNYHAGSEGLAPVADAIRGGQQNIWALGLNWYVNNNIRFMLDYQHVEIDRLAPNNTSFNTPANAQVGQDYDTIAARAQFGF